MLGDGAKGQPSQKAAHCQGGKEEPKSFGRLEPVVLAPTSSWPVCKGVPLTIGHESHNGMGGATQVGRGTLVGYNSKQGNGTVRGETKHDSQHQDPELQGSEVARSVRKPTYLPPARVPRGLGPRTNRCRRRQ